MKSMRYAPCDIEKKWQARWEKEHRHACDMDSGRPKYYLLEMFPYPSGNIHMGHARNYAIGDVVARFFRMRGYNVLHPMGWDAFGLPAENAAIRGGVHPAAWTWNNIESMRSQMKRLGYSYDWERELATCHPAYYRWEQLFFLRCLEKGLAYRKKASQNWCPGCRTVLANEQVVEGLCWRCESRVEQKELTQWFLRVTAYADELLADMEKLEKGWPERVLTMQRNWIGKSVGAELTFPLAEGEQGEDITVFTTRPDTLFGATFVTLAPEHSMVDGLIRGKPGEEAIRAFVGRVKGVAQEERQSDQVEKEGVFTGAYCLHPLTGERLPIWLGNFVLASYGTGAVMAVPAHDQRDFEFARKYGLEVRLVIQPEGEELNPAVMTAAVPEYGRLVNSGRFDGLSSEQGKNAVIEALEAGGRGRSTVNWRLRDWNISRQRYWGTPIPVVYCPECGVVPVRESDLPVTLPLDITTHADGRSPLPDAPEFLDTPCPVCGRPARRETDTMDTFVESSWYFSRFTSPRKDDAPFDAERMAYWMPVDQYIGGVEHAILHLLYARFFTKVLRDMGYYPPDLDEPFANLLTQGMVIKDGFKMSKSKGNVVEPTLMIDRYGADTVRLFCLFAAPPERDIDWSESGIEGAYRFAGRVWRLCVEWQTTLPLLAPCSSTPAQAAASPAARALRRREHLTVKKATEDIGNRFQFNTAIAAVMELINALYLAREELTRPDAAQGAAEIFSSAVATALALLFPIMPHLCEELWETTGHAGRLEDLPWPVWSEEALEQDMATVVIQVNGKLRGKLDVAAGTDARDIERLALAEPNIARHLDGLIVRRVVVIPDKLVNVVAN